MMTKYMLPPPHRCHLPRLAAGAPAWGPLYVCMGGDRPFGRHSGYPGGPGFMFAVQRITEAP